MNLAITPTNINPINNRNKHLSFGAINLEDKAIIEVLDRAFPEIGASTTALCKKNGRNQLASALNSKFSDLTEMLAKFRASRLSKKYPNVILTTNDLKAIAESPFRYPKAQVICAEAKPLDCKTVIKILGNFDTSMKRISRHINQGETRGDNILRTDAEKQKLLHETLVKLGLAEE